MRFLVFAILAAACGDNRRPPPDAPLPSCADVGCPEVSFCTVNQPCTCIPSPGAEPIPCIVRAPRAR